MFVRRSLLTATALVATFLPVLLAQPAPRRPIASWLIRAHVFLGDRGLQKELGLTDEQAKKATELASNGLRRASSYSGITDDKEREKIDAECKKELAFLKPEQMTRLREVIVQYMANIGRTGATALLGDAEVVKRLKFTDEQTKKIRDLAKLDDVLTDEQKKEWAKLTGKPYTETLRAGGEGVRRLTPITLPIGLQLLAARSVRVELKLTAKQQQQIEALTAKLERELGKANDTKSEALAAAGEKEALALLDEAQSKRLGQIEAQAVTLGFEEDAVLSYAPVAAALKLGDDQKRKIASTTAKRREEMLALFAADEDARKIIENLQSFKKETTKQLLALLDKTQQERLKDFVGPRFEGFLPAPLRSSPPPTSTLYLYGPGSRYLGSADLHKELKVDEATSKKLSALAERARAEFVRTFGSSDQEARQRAEANKKEVSAILDAKQMKRFEEIYLDFIATSPVPVGSPNPAYRYAEVQQALKLTDAQKRKLSGGEAVEKVLDAEQSKTWKAMRGERFSGVLTMPTTAVNPVFYLYDQGAVFLGSEDLHKELKVDETTAKKLVVLAERAAEKTAGFPFASRLSSSNPAEARSRAEANKKVLSAILDAKQWKRFEEIYLSHVADRLTGFSRIAISPFLYAEVQEALKLTDAQKQMLLRSAAAKLLDESQANKWKEMRGKPFEGSLVAAGDWFDRAARPLFLSALLTPAVLDELKPTEEQQKQLLEAEFDYYTERRGGGGFGVGAAKRRRAQAELERTVKKVLNDKQNARLQQILWQDAKAFGLRTLLVQASVKAALKIDDVQQRKIDDLNHDTDELRSLLLKENLRPGDLPEAITRASEAVTKNSSKRLEAALTEKQREQLANLLGKPFAGKIEHPSRSGGFAGGGGFGD